MAAFLKTNPVNKITCPIPDWCFDAARRYSTLQIITSMKNYNRALCFVCWLSSIQNILIMKTNNTQLFKCNAKLSLIRLLFFCILFCFWGQLFSQSSIQGRIKDVSLNPINGCNVLLLRSNDSLLLQGTLSKDSGYFELTGITNGNYLIVISFSGYEKKYSPLEISDSPKKDIGDVILNPTSSKLKQVTVTAYKPLFEQMPDRTVVNVKNSITNAGVTVLDVLEKSPGILVNRQNGIISMSGKDGVQVMINGKRNYLTSEALIAMLEGMNANNVEKIELITNPPAKYDAAGNAGFINIVIAQNPDEGFTATMTLTMAAFYGTAPAANFDFNYKKRKSNFYGGYSFNRRTQKVHRSTHRTIDLFNDILETFTTGTMYRTRPNHAIRLGYDFDWTKKTTIGMLVSGYQNGYNEEARIRSVFTTNSAIDTTVIVDSREKNPWKHAMANIYVVHRPDKLSQLSFNLDLLLYENSDLATYYNNYFNRSDAFVRADDVISSQYADFTIFPLQLDYKRKLNDKVTMEAGLKKVSSQFTNNILVATLQPSGWEADANYTAAYKLKENIHAAYLSSTFLINKKNTFQAGLRYEHTKANLGTNDRKDIVNRQYGKLFPSFFWSHKLKSNRSFNFSYSRRINRPAFNQLAPFLFFSDPSSVITGNPALQPAISDALNLDYLFRQFVVSAGYTHESDYNNGFLPLVDTVSQKQVNIPRNITYLKTINVRVTWPVTITRWWSSVINLNATWQKSRAEDYVTITQERSAARVFISGSETFRIAKQNTIEISGLYVSKGLSPSGLGIRQSYGNLNIAGQRKLTKPGSAILVGVDNIFSSMNPRVFTNVPEAKFSTRVNLPSNKRIYKITFTYRFGNKAMKEKKARSTASEEERKRVGN